MCAGWVKISGYKKGKCPGIAKNIRTRAALLLVIKVAVARIDVELVYQIALPVKDFRLPVIALDCKIAGFEVGMVLQVAVQELDDLPGIRRCTLHRRTEHA
jgi:hypothetical protein